MKAATRNETKAVSDGPVSNYAQHLVAAANANDNSTPEKEVFNGYYFRVVPEKLGGAAIVAYPAEYRVSGVMTFVLTPSGSVYQKDLGPQTSTLAKQIQGASTGNWIAVRPGSTP